MLPVSQDVVVVSHWFTIMATPIGCFHLLPNDASSHNEKYYLERELELIRQSNLDLELEALEERHILEVGEEVLLSPVPIKPGESESKAEKESPPDQPAGEIPF
jgi:hypothetical protein